MGLRNQRASFWTPIAIAFLLLSGCPKPEEPVLCDINADCAEEEACLEGVCEPVECDPACAEGGACIHGECFCVEDDYCEAWQICTDGECENDPDAECSPYRDCAIGYICEGADCVCARDWVCPEQEVCDGGECRAATACTVDAECSDEERICVDGFCVQPCIDAQECGSPSFFYACIDGYCLDRCLTSDQECDSGFICEEVGDDTICVEAECATLTDCSGADEVCSSADHGRCVVVEYCEDDDGCDWTQICGVPSPCPPGFDCANDMICLGRPTCMFDDDCARDGGQGYCDRGYCFEVGTCQSRDECPAGFDCVGGICVPFACRGPADCDAGEICSGGECVVPDGDATVDRVEILTPGGFILEGEERDLVALAYDNTGEVIVGASIVWSSTAPDSVAVDAATGVITGGGEAGAAIIMATYGTESATSTWQLLPALGENELRVTVVDGENGALLAGATVLLSAGLEDVTGDDGSVVFVVESMDPVDVHAFADTHDYLSVFDSAARDILLPLPRRSNPMRAAGVTGGISYANVTTEGDLAIGLGGTSLGAVLPDFDMARLVGDIFVTEVPMVGDIPLPGAMTAEATYMGFPFTLKDTYYALGEEGLRMGWSFAGRLSMDRLMGGGGMDMNIASILSSFGLFEHGLVSRLPLAERALIRDVADINGNDDTDEMVPDWTRFPQANHAPGQVQTLRLLVSSGDLPSFSGDRLSTVVLLAGGRPPRLGLVPLGLTAAERAADATSIEPVRMRMAPVYGGLEVGRYQVIAMAIPEVSGLEMPRQVSARVVTATYMPEEVVFDDFLGFSESSSWDSSARTIEYASVPRAHLLRCVVQGTDRAWHVYGRDPGEGSASFVLPEIPEGLDDLEEMPHARVSPMELASPMTFDDLVHIGGAGILQLDEVTAAFSTLIK